MPVNTALQSTGTTQFSDVSVRGLTLAGEAPLRVSSFQTFAVVAFSLTANTSTETTLNYNVVTPAANDVCVVAAPSGISQGILFQAYVDSANSVRLRFSNSSTAAASQTAQTWGIALLRYGT